VIGIDSIFDTKSLIMNFTGLFDVYDMTIFSQLGF